MQDIIVGIILVAILGAAGAYIGKQKKKGAKCIGCPHSKTCGKGGFCSCGK